MTYNLSEFLSTALPYIFSIGVPLLIFIYVSFIRIPGWHNELKEATNNKFSWVKLNVVAFIISALIGSTSAFVSSLANIQDVSIAALATGTASLAYVFVQSTVSDLKIRYVDRGTLRLAIFFSFCMGLTYYVYNAAMIPDIERNVWIIAFIVASALMYLPGMGASDSRALSLCIAAATPTLGVIGGLFAILFYVLSGLTYVIFIVMKYRVSSIAYVQRISIPAVPFIIAPFLILMIYAPFDVLFQLGWVDSAIGWLMFWNQ